MFLWSFLWSKLWFVSFLLQGFAFQVFSVAHIGARHAVLLCFKQFFLYCSIACICFLLFLSTRFLVTAISYYRGGGVRERQVLEKTAWLVLSVWGMLGRFGGRCGDDFLNSFWTCTGKSIIRRCLEFVCVKPLDEKLNKTIHIPNTFNDWFSQRSLDLRIQWFGDPLSRIQFEINKCQIRRPKENIDTQTNHFNFVEERCTFVICQHSRHQVILIRYSGRMTSTHRPHLFTPTRTLQSVVSTYMVVL